MVCVKNNFLRALCEAESLFVKAVWVCQTTRRCNLMMIDGEYDEEDGSWKEDSEETGSRSLASSSQDSTNESSDEEGSDFVEV